jgi:glycosidase
MTDVAVPAALVQDKMRAGAGGRFSRDRSRTPMPWDASPSAGFTAEGVTPWLPIGEHAKRNVAAEQADPASILNLCRELLALRRAEFGGRLASYTQLPSQPGLWVYQTGRLTVLTNFTGSPVRLAEPVAELGEVLVSTAPAGEAAEAGVLGPWSGIVARTEPED